MCSSDLALIETVIALRDPTFAFAFARSEGRVIAALESVLACHVRVVLIDASKGRQDNFGGKWQRTGDGPGRECTVVRAVGDAARNVIVESSGFTIDSSHGRTRTIACCDSPTEATVPNKFFRVAHCISLLGIDRTAAVLKDRKSVV